METVLAIIPATALLYNIAKKMHEPKPPELFEINEEKFQYLIQLGQVPEVPINDNLMFERNLVHYFSKFITLHISL